MLQLRDDDKDDGFNFEFDSEMRMAVWVPSNDFTFLKTFLEQTFLKNEIGATSSCE